VRESTTATITVSGVLSVSISADPRMGYVGYRVTFTVEWSPYEPIGYDVYIDYGDGSTDWQTVYAGQAIFDHVYRSPGTYMVRVEVTSGYGDYGSDEIGVHIAEPLTVGLSADPTSGRVPLTVTFTCSARYGHPPYKWTLDFGDGSAPVSGTRDSEGSWTVEHTFEKVGTFMVTLTVEDSGGEA